MPVAAKRQWLGEIEISRGLAILAVLLIHITGLPVREFPPGSPAYLFYVLINRGCQFAVPLFLMISALVLAHRCGGEQLDRRAFYLSRGRQVVVPYLVWTTIALGFRFLVLGETVPRSVNPWAFWYLCGKGYFHLYFLVIIIQFYLLFPLLQSAWRRCRPGFGTALAVFAAAQVAFYWLNRLCIYEHFPYPGSILFSYIFPIGIGFWLGGNVPRWAAWWRACRWGIAAAAALAGAVYIRLSLLSLSGQAINTFAFQTAWQIYVTALGILVIFLSRRLLRSTTAEAALRLRGLRAVSRDSFGIYLMHPFILFFWQKLIHPTAPLGLHLSVWAGLLFILGGSMAGVWLAQRLSLGAVLFGTRSRPAPPAPQYPAAP